MKTIILLILSAFTAFAATTYPVLTDNPVRTFSGGGTNLALLNGTNVFTGTNTFSGPATITNSANNISAAGYGSAQQTLAYTLGTNITVNASKALHFATLTNTAYFAQPTSLAVGASFTIHLRQDATGARAVTFDTNYWKFPGGYVPTITTNANAFDVISCVACPYGTNVFAIVNQKFQ